MSGLAPIDRRDDRTLPSLSSLFGPPIPRPNSLGVSQAAHAQAFPQRSPSPHFSGILRPVNSLHNLANYGPPGSIPHPPPHVAHPVRDLPSIDRVHISHPQSNSHLAPPPTHNIFSAAPAYRPAPPVTSHYPPFLHGRTTSESTATTDVQSNRSSTAFSTSNATSVTDLSSVRSSTISRTSSKIVGIQDVPGEGEHYVYEDGHMMKAVIGGERVNPAWGITKAGKPRKRLAKACMTCREKKIKCEQGDPGDSRCGQCARTNRVCRIPQDLRSSPEPPESSRSSAPGSAGPTAPPPLSEERLMLSQGLHDHSAVRKRTHDMFHLNGGGVELNPTTPTDEWLSGQTPNGSRGENGRGFFSDLTVSSGPPAPSIRRRAKQSTKGRQFSSPRAPPRIDPSVFTPQVDPYLADPEATIYFLELLFYFRNKGPYNAIPREPILTWVRATRDKSIDDLMMIYACMAFGARFAIDNDIKDCGKTFHDIAYQLERQRTSRYSLQLIHTRTALIFYFFSLGDFESAFEYTANAVRALTMLRYQDENTIASVPEDKTTHEYGMTAQQLRECRRRTFWVVWMVDRYNSFSFGSMGLIHDVEVFLRMPCGDHDWMNSVNVQMPFFRGESTHEPYQSRPGDMAMLIDVVRLWGRVTAHAYSSINRDAKTYAEYYNNYYAQTREELRTWVSNLPEELRFTNDNMMRALGQGYFSQFYIMHAIYCLVGMKLGRIGRVEYLSDEIRRRNLRVALFHARIYLHMVTQLSKAIYSSPGDDIDLAFSQPFPGYALTNAVDIVSSGGRAASLAAMTNNELEAAKTVVEQKANFWVISKKQQQLIDDRQGLLSAYGINGGSKTDRHRIPEAIDRSFLPVGHDMVYEIPDAIFFEVVLDESNQDQDPLGILS